MILDEIVAYKREELAREQAATSLAELRAMQADAPPPRDFAAALARPGVSLIAEVKRASPSKGLLCPDFDPVRLALTYAEHGAAAISVLTDRHFFQGELDYLRRIRRALTAAGHALPLLRKDFVFDPYQVHAARAYGADALLLIAAILDDAQLADLLALTHDLGMAALIEVHDAAEAARTARLHAAGHPVTVVGVNNRNLHDFSVNLATFEALAPQLPADVVAVAESGIHTPADVRSVVAAGAAAILVGEALVTAEDTGERVRALVNAIDSSSSSRFSVIPSEGVVEESLTLQR